MPAYRSFIRRLWPLAVLVTGGCGCCDCLPPPKSKLASVVIRPSDILAQPATEFALEATVRDFSGRTLDVAADPNLHITWTAPTGVIADPNQNPALVVVPASSSLPIKITAKVTDLATGTFANSNGVTVTVSPVTGSSAALALDATDLSDWAFVEHPPKNPVAALLVQAGEDGVKRIDWALGVVGSVRLGHDLDQSGDDNEVGVFARDRSPELMLTDPTAGFWKDARDDVDADPMDPIDPLNPLPEEDLNLRALPVMGLVDKTDRFIEGIDAGEWAEAHIQAAFNLLNRNRVGIDLDLRPTGEHDLKDSAGNAIPVVGPEGTCAVAGPDTYLGGGRAMSDGVLYVLFVPDIQFIDPTNLAVSTRSGWACKTEDGWTGRVVFVSEAEGLSATLAHELGHVLALTTGQVEGASGHVNGIPGFDASNLMWSDDPAAGAARSRLTLGQIYRMNFDPDSWLNATDVVPTSVRVVRACESSAARGVCPALAADLGG